MPLLVPLRREHVKGGRDAENEVVSALNRYLQAYRTAAPLSAAHARPVALMRGNRFTMQDRAHLNSGMSWGVSGTSIGVYGQISYLNQVTAVMARDLPASSYHLDQMGNPVVDATATPEALQRTKEIICEVRARDAAAARRKHLPANCISELVQASKRAHPEYKGPSPDCYVALRVTLRPSPRPGACPREGELLIKAFAWTAEGLYIRSVFKPWDDWPSILGKREHRAFPLGTTIQLLATGVTAPYRQPASSSSCEVSGPGPSMPGPSGSATGRAEPFASLSAATEQRVQAEHRRAERLYGRLRVCSDVQQSWSINTLLEFMKSGELPMAQQPPGLTVTMRPYQLQSLAFMVDLERLADGPGASGSPGRLPSSSAAGTASAERTDEDLSDVDGAGGYRRLFWVPITNSKGQRFWYSPVFERLTMDVPAQPIGGFLAEEMGLGKTVEVMALTLANPPAPSVVAGASLPCGRIQSRATLVVCAVSLVGQWHAEAQNKTTGACRIHPYHGPSRIRDPVRLATEFDVVVTTYQTLQSDHAAGCKNPCQAIKWHRIVFDEGHMLKSVGAKLSKAANELSADRKWVCTGTPINNSVDDLLGQFSALHMMPLGKKTFFDCYIKLPFIGARGHGARSFLPLLYAIRHTLIRHTKAQNLGGHEVLQLPAKTETDVPVLVSPAEQALYTKVHKEAQRAWQKLKSAGPKFVNSHLFSATSMLMPLRRICSGGQLKPQDLLVPDPERLAALAGPAAAAGGAAAAGEQQEVPVPDDIAECPICVDALDEPVVTPCNHWFCKECITGWINTSAHHNCPACRQPVTKHSLRRGVRSQAAQVPDEATGAEVEASGDGSVACESKLQALMAALRAMRNVDPTAKALVFTQFSQTLEWLKPRLLAEGFGHRSITGDMTQKKRSEAVETFQRDPSVTVFLLSVRSGAVGINLTAANHIFLMEPCMNPAMEEQAIGRAWRMGQQRAVMVKRLYVKGSVEERIMEVVKSRRSASGAADGAAEGGSAAGTGSLRHDKTDLRINELEVLFREPEFPPSPADVA